VNGKLSAEYRSWQAMKTRCYNPNSPKYKKYHGRGIAVCERWLNSFPNFLKDMGRKSNKELTLDRIDNDKGYSPENCRWADKATQNHDQSMRSNNTSGYTGVMAHNGRWWVTIGHNNKRVSLNVWACKHEAAMVRELYKEKHKIRPYDL